MPKYEHVKDSELMSGKQSPNLIFSLISGECDIDLLEPALNFLPFLHLNRLISYLYNHRLLVHSEHKAGRMLA
jgi:hypothetical protein